METSDLKFGFAVDDIINDGLVKATDIRNLKNWIVTQPFPKLTEEQLVLFLLSCDNDFDFTKKTIKSHYDIKAEFTNVFTNRKLTADFLESILNIGEFCVFPKYMDDRSVVIYYTFGTTSFRLWSYETCVKAFFMVLDIVLNDYPPNYLVLIIDMKEMNLGHFFQLRPSLIRVMFQYLQDGLPLKLKNIHLLNAVYFVNKILALIRPFVKKEIMDKIVCHTREEDINEFHENWIPKKCLSCDLGGDLPPVATLHKEMLQKLHDFEEFFEKEELQRALLI